MLSYFSHWMANPVLESFRESPKACVTNSSRPPEILKGKENPDLPLVCSNYWPPNFLIFIILLHWILLHEYTQNIGVLMTVIIIWYGRAKFKSNFNCRFMYVVGIDWLKRFFLWDTRTFLRQYMHQKTIINFVSIVQLVKPYRQKNAVFVCFPCNPSPITGKEVLYK